MDRVGRRPVLAQEVCHGNTSQRSDFRPAQSSNAYGVAHLAHGLAVIIFIEIRKPNLPSRGAEVTNFSPATLAHTPHTREALPRTPRHRSGRSAFLPASSDRLAPTTRSVP